MEYIKFKELEITPKESNFIGHIAVDLLVKTGSVPSNEAILKEIIYRAMLINGKDVPKH